MPLHGKIVVIKRSGGDGTEFPLTATCLFGRKPDCDIRIQLPHVSKEHCRIDLNENKEVILTNLSSSNPTCVNGKALQQAESLKHGDVITIIDRSFRFEYPPAPTPKKKRSSIGSKTEGLKVLQDQVVDTVEREEKRKSEVSTDPHLKDGANHDNIQRSLEKTLELESTEDSQLQSKTNSPFSDLYQMIKQSLDVKTPRKSSASQVQTPARFCTPKPVSLRKNEGNPAFTPKKDEAKIVADPGGKASGTPQSVKKQGKPIQVPFADLEWLREEEAESVNKLKATSPRRRNSTASQKFSVAEVIELISSQSPMRRRSKEATPAKPSVTREQEETVTTPKTELPQRRSPRSSGKAEKVQKRKSGEIGRDLPTQPLKKKRVSFGGHLSPEFFDKRLPPDSPLCKGATPRRSLCAFKPKQSLLRRASVIGLLKEGSPAKTKTPSPKKSKSLAIASPKTLSGKNSPKSRSPSPKPASPGKKTSQSRSSSPKDASPKVASPARSPKSRSSSPKSTTPEKKSPKAATPAKNSSQSKSSSPSTNKVETPKGKSTTPDQDAFRVTPINKRRSLGTTSPASVKKASSVGVTLAKTPSNPEVQTPTVQGRFSVSRISTPSPTVAKQEPSVTVTPKIPLKRKSMKSASRKTPSVAKSAVKILQRRSGVSRASMKLAVPWTDIVKFGKTKPQVVVPAKKKIQQKMTKKAVLKPQTPARKPLGHVSTGHADSPATIVVGRAHKRTVLHPAGAVPRVVTNTALCKKNMKMDEDLTGISEMFKTPVHERRRKSLITESSIAGTPAGNPGTSMVEQSVLHTPEELGEMIVSPLSVASTVKSQRYNSEAVQRLLDGDEEASFVSDTPALEIPSESSEQRCSDLKTNSKTTPKQKPELPECVTGVKRMMKTPRQKAEPVEDLRGKLLKTPKQKPEQQECLTGVKRIMKTPRQKAEPIEDLRGKILKTPKQKAEQQECLTGVKRIMKTPRQKAEPVEDIRGKLLLTPKQKPEQQECLTGVKRIFKTPKQKAEPLEDLRGKLLKTPKAKKVGDVSLDGVKELLETPTHVQKPDDQSEITDVKTPLGVGSPVLCLIDVRRMVEEPKVKSSPAEDKVGERLKKTPKQKGKPVEENFGIKRLMKSPRLRGAAPVEDFEGLKELMEEPVTNPSGQLEPNQDEDNVPKDRGVHEAKEPVANEDESSDIMETISSVPEQQHQVETGDEISPEVETPADKVTEMDATASALGCKKTSARGRRAKPAEAAAREPAPVRGRRQKKTETAVPPAVRNTTRGRKAETTENKDVEPTVGDQNQEDLPLKPKRGRNTKKVTDQAETVQEVLNQMETAPEPESEQRPTAEVEEKANECAERPEKAVVKPKRGRKRPEQSAPQKQDAPVAQTEDAPRAAAAKADASEIGSDQQEVLPSNTDEDQSEAMKTVQAPEAENLPDLEKEACKVPEMETPVVQKKAVRGRRAKLVEFKETEDKKEAVEYSDEPAVPVPVRGRKGRKMEAAAPPAAKQTTRSRRAKSPEGTADRPAVETEVTGEISQAPPIITCQENTDSAPPADKVASKPLRGRKPKQTPVEPAQLEPEKTEEEPPTAGKPKRGRKAKENEVVEDTVSTVEIKQETQPAVRAKRGRNTKQEEGEKTTLIEATDSQEPVKKLRRTRKPEQGQVEPKEEVQTVEIVAPVKAETPAVELEAVSEQSCAKPRRGGRKAKSDTENVGIMESTELKEVLISSTDKPKRGKRGKKVTEVASTENPEPQQELKEEKKPEECSAKEGKTSQVIPAKRARRGAAPEESAEESTSGSAPAPVKPAKRGRRAAVNPTADEVLATSDKASSSEDLNKPLVEHEKSSNKSVKWKSCLEVFDIPKSTPVKAVRGRKSKLTNQVASKDPNEDEEDLSDKVVVAQPAKRGRRGATVADVTAESKSKGSIKNAEAEPQPKTRRGRSAKK
ncbi:proliferation marker protein Ki-67 isoform X2 [Melanotaenia boesemani]|uniref:proliferation marker protein Ki-67 isoform X2 n=1 Tax=Melanotaenia boesemani TaxID=1250792 RepID=UPI001C04C6C4|nr:proliferation marker protein Ki-67 isoform X2 [Melanotaenia boesemani]